MAHVQKTESRDPFCIRKSEPVVSILFTLALLALLNASPDLGAVIRLQEAGQAPVPLFSDVFSAALPWINLSLLASILLDIVKLSAGSWTLPVVGAHLVLKLPGFLVAVWLFSNPAVFNVDFFEAVQAIYPVDSPMAPSEAAEMTRKIILGITIFGYIVDILTAGSKAVRLLLAPPGPEPEA